jgi:hypothetical protein
VLCDAEVQPWEVLCCLFADWCAVYGPQLLLLQLGLLRKKGMPFLAEAACAGIGFSAAHHPGRCSLLWCVLLVKLFA